MSSSAEDAKTLGNRAFAKGKYAAAVEAYTEAISLSPRPVYYTNRANAHMKRGAWRAAADDCASALALGSVATRERIKAHYFLGRAHVELGEWQSGIEALATAHALCKEETVPFKDDIRSALLGARKRAWEAAAPAGGRAIKALRRLNAQLVFNSRLAPSTAGLRDTLEGCGTGWGELLGKYDRYIALCLYAAVSAGGSFRAYARADLTTTRRVLDALGVATCVSGDDVVRLCVQRRAFNDKGLELACRFLRRPPLALSNAQFDAKRDLDALRTAYGAKPKTEPTRMPSEPLEIVAAWMALRA